MYKILIISALILLTACGEERSGEVVGHVPLTVGEVTYQWPIDRTTSFKELGDPNNWKNHGYISERMWNELTSSIPSLHRTGYKGIITVWLFPKRMREWSIQPDGRGLPLSSSERFEIVERGNGFTLGKRVGEGIVSPSTLATFDGEKHSYMECSPYPGAHYLSGICFILTNDRGIEHRIPVKPDNVNNAKDILFFYRALIGVPQPI